MPERSKLQASTSQTEKRGPKLPNSIELGRILGDNFVFRDFEMSQIDGMRRAFEVDTVKLSLYSFFVIAFWQFCITLGGSQFYTDNLALGLLPSGAHIVLVAGAVVFPLRLWHLLFVVYTVTYFTPILFDIWSFPPPAENGLSKNELITFLFVLNVGICLATVVLIRTLFSELKKYRSPITIDLVAAVATQIVFTTLFFLAVLFIQKSGTIFAADLRAAFGFDDALWSLAYRRIALGGVTATAFLIAIIQRPRLSYLPKILALSSVFVVYVVVHRSGFTVLPELEIALIIAIVAQAANIRYAPLAILIGMSLFTGLTGYAIGSAPPISDIDKSILTYATLVVALAGLNLTFRSYSSHVNQQRNSSLRRLNAVRNFANVGLFAVNVDARQIRFDGVTQKIFNAPPKMDLGTLMQRFPKEEQTELRNILYYGPNETGDILARFKHMEQEDVFYIRLFLWNEINSNGQPMVYGLAIDVTAEHNNEKVLSETLDELEYRSEKMTQMFSIISHEIRSPAAVISMLIDDLEGNSAVAETKQNLRDATDHLLNVLNDMRQAVNPEKNLPVNLKPFNVEEITTSVRNTFAFQARDAGFDISLQFGDGAQDARIGDSTRIKQILGNVLRNAIVHSGGSRVKISYSTEEVGERRIEHAVWTITDNGVGIADNQIERLFEPFQRGEVDPRNRVDGSGLGLYIVKISAQVLGGSVKYFSPVEGGAGYRISIPAPLYVPAAEIAEGDAVDPRFTLDRIKVLLVEDNRLVSQVVESRLRKIVKDIKVAGNGLQALDVLKTYEPDLIISDLFMPQMAGDELCAELRSGGFDKPIIGLTAATVGDEMHDFLEAGATIVLPKPLEVTQLTGFLWSYYKNHPEQAEAVFGAAPSVKSDGGTPAEV